MEIPFLNLYGQIEIVCIKWTGLGVLLDNNERKTIRMQFTMLFFRLCTLMHLWEFVDKIDEDTTFEFSSFYSVCNDDDVEITADYQSVRVADFTMDFSFR